MLAGLHIVSGGLTFGPNAHACLGCLGHARPHSVAPHSLLKIRDKSGAVSNCIGHIGVILGLYLTLPPTNGTALDVFGSLSGA